MKNCFLLVFLTSLLFSCNSSPSSPEESSIETSSKEKEMPSKKNPLFTFSNAFKLKETSDSNLALFYSENSTCELDSVNELTQNEELIIYFKNIIDSVEYKIEYEFRDRDIEGGVDLVDLNDIDVCGIRIHHEQNSDNYILIGEDNIADDKDTFKKDANDIDIVGTGILFDDISILEDTIVFYMDNDSLYMKSVKNNAINQHNGDNICL